MPNKEGRHFKKVAIWILLSVTDLSIKTLLSANPNKAVVQANNKIGNNIPASTPNLFQIKIL